MTLFASAVPTADVSAEEYSMDVIELRFQQLDLAISADTDAIFHRRLKAYLLDGRKYSGQMLDRMAMYFPYIEEQLEKRGLPQELKYLTITESAVNPNARSRAGAVGLWQIMSGTAQYLGLRVGRIVDERRDPILATEAALDYLEELFEKFQDWELALAAYNCGPGRVNQAVRRSGSKDFEVVKRFLPYETRQYIPSFLAAVYFGNYHFDHGIYKEVDNFDLVLTGSRRIFKTLNFTTLSEITGVNRDVIHRLNSAFRAGYIPSSQKGYNVILPLRALHTLELEGEHDVQLISKEEGNHKVKRVFEEYVVSSVLIEGPLDWQELADELYVNPYQLKYLNYHVNGNGSNGKSYIRFVIPRFSGFLVNAIEDEEDYYAIDNIETLPSPTINPLLFPGGPILPPQNSPVVFARESQMYGQRIRRMAKLRNTPGRGQSLSDVERIEKFNSNKASDWKSAFAGE